MKLTLAMLMMGMLLSGTSSDYCDQQYDGEEDESKYIFRGDKVTDSQRYPFLVSVRNSKDEHVCGGYLTEIGTTQVVITAARCIFNYPDLNSTFMPAVQAGTTQSASLKDQGGAWACVNRSFIRFDFIEPQPPRSRNVGSFAVLVLNRPFPIGGNIQLATLVSPSQVHQYWPSCYMMGWGGLYYKVGTEELISQTCPHLTEIDGRIEKPIGQNPHVLKVTIDPTYITKKMAGLGDLGGPLTCSQSFGSRPQWYVYGPLVDIYNADLEPNYKSPAIQYYQNMAFYGDRYKMVEIFQGDMDLPRGSDYPYIVSLRNSNDVHVCGGYLIQDDTVVTAAYCVLDIETKTTRDVLRVRIGNKVSHGNLGLRIDVKRRFVSQQFERIRAAPETPPTYLADLGVLVLQKPAANAADSKPENVHTEPLDPSQLEPRCAILFWGGYAQGQGAGQGNLPSGLKIFPHVRKVYGRIAAIEPGVFVQSGVFYVDVEENDFPTWYEMRRTDLGSPLACKKLNHEEWHVAGVLVGFGSHEPHLQTKLKYMSAQARASETVFTELL